MTAACTRLASWAALVDYWARELDPVAEEALEEHLMGCTACSERSERVGAITEGIRRMLPVLLSEDALARLRAEGARVLEHTMDPGERKDVVFPPDVEVLVHRLSGLDLADATHVAFTLRAERTGELLAEVADVAFDPAQRSVLVACQQHYVAFPPDTVAELRVRRASGDERVTRYTILHRFVSP